MPRGTSPGRVEDWRALPRAFRSIKRLIWIAAKAELQTAEMRVVVLAIEPDMHGREVNIAPGALDRVCLGKPGGAAQRQQGVDRAHDQLRSAAVVAHRARQNLG